MVSVSAFVTPYMHLGCPAVPPVAALMSSPQLSCLPRLAEIAPIVHVSDVPSKSSILYCSPNRFDASASCVSDTHPSSPAPFPSSSLNNAPGSHSQQGGGGAAASGQGGPSLTRRVLAHPLQGQSDRDEWRGVHQMLQAGSISVFARRHAVPCLHATRSPPSLC